MFLLDVVVVGGGPVGSRVAFKLAGMGHQVAVIEKRDAIGQKPCCTGIISQECFDSFSIPSGVVLRQANSAQIFSPSGESIRVYRPQTQACIVHRPAFDSFLADQAKGKGASYFLSSRVDSISYQTDRAVIRIDSIREGSLDARAVVLATGFSAALARRLKLGLPGYFVAGAQAEVELIGVDEVEVYFDQKLAPGFFAWIVPTSPGRGLVGLLTRRSPGLRLREWLDSLMSRGKVVSNSYTIRYGGIPLKPLPRTFGDRFLVVGDAAGQVKPTTGGGLYFGLLCADIAADCLHAALLSGDVSAGSLFRYEQCWKKKLGAELRMEYFARRIYEHLSDKRIDSLFSRIKAKGLVDSVLQEKDLSFDWHGGLMMRVLKMGAASQINKLISLPRRLKKTGT